MTNQLEWIYKRKKKLISTLKKARNEYISTVYEGLLKKKTFQEIHRDILKISKVYGISYTKPIEKFATELAKKNSKKQDIENLYLPFLLIFTQTNTLAFEEAKRYEADKKLEIIDTDIRDGNKNGRIWYLISKHRDSAKDHENYQGKLYIDENWESIITDETTKERIHKYIKTNNIKTFQWVIGKPVWMITRPNCRHFYKQLSTDEVFGSSTNKLLRKNKMTFKTGKREIKTLKVGGYTKADILAIIKTYEDRLAYHKALLEKDKENKKLRHFITKDKFLISKWKEYLSKFK